jgi:hypothetical protein
MRRSFALIRFEQGFNFSHFCHLFDFVLFIFYIFLKKVKLIKREDGNEQKKQEFEKGGFMEAG